MGAERPVAYLLRCDTHAGWPLRHIAKSNSRKIPSFVAANRLLSKGFSICREGQP
jgi:hypothetical protein